MFHGGDEAIEHVAVERLAVELVEVVLGVLLRDRVVARHDAIAPAGRRRRDQRAASADTTGLTRRAPPRSRIATAPSWRRRQPASAAS
jgi:hypothetical protein